MMQIECQRDAVTPSSAADAADASYCSDEDDDGDSTQAGFTASVKTHPLIHSSVHQIINFIMAYRELRS